MKVHTQKLKKGGAKITVILTDKELAALSKICDGNGGFGAGAADPDSPLRTASFQACQQFFPTEGRLPPGYQVTIPAG